MKQRVGGVRPSLTSIACSPVVVTHVVCAQDVYEEDEEAVDELVADGPVLVVAEEWILSMADDMGEDICEEYVLRGNYCATL